LKNTQLIVGNYLHRYQKFVVFCLLIIAIFGVLNFLFKYASLFESFFGVLFLIISYFLFVILIGKKGLYIVDDTLYLGISVGNSLLIKEKIDSNKFDGFNYERKKKTNLPCILEYSGAAIFSNYHECFVYLIKFDSKKRKRLISLTDFDQYKDVRDFLHRWTRLKEQTDMI
jgi:hypothetical protein